MPRTRIVSEAEHGRGWLFVAEIDPEAAGGSPRRREVTLSWADHERWCGGAKPPCDIAERVLRFAIGRGLLDRLGERFDCSTVRRLAPEIEAFLTDGDQDPGSS